MRLTYLINTYNRLEVLIRHLELLKKQTYREPFEIIVCDDGSTDGTLEYLEREEYKWFSTYSQENTAARSKNNGIRAARGKVLIMMDDDCLPHPQLIEKYLERFNPQHIQLGYKSCGKGYLDMPLPVPIEPGDMEIWATQYNQRGTIDHFQCGNICMSIEAARTPAKDGSLGFDERFVGYGHEDIEFGQRLFNTGYYLVFNQDAVAWHMNPNENPLQIKADTKDREKSDSKNLLDRILREPWPTMNAVYPGFNHTAGMMTPGELRWLYNQAMRMRSVVEIGSFAGRSTHALLSGCEGPVWAIDQWESTLFASPEHREDIRKAFYRNTEEFKNRKVLELSSLDAVRSFIDGSMDMVFIDGDHVHPAPILDIAAWLPKTVRLICGHDFSPTFPDVVSAVQESFGNEYGLCETIWFKELS